MNLDHQHTTLGQCAIINDRTFSPKEAWPFVNYLDTGSITDNHITKFHLIESMDKLPSRARRKVKQGDIVYSTVRPNMRHFGILQELPDNVLVSTGFAVIRGVENLSHTNYVYWLLTQDKIIDHLQTLAEHSTSAYPSIRPSDLGNLEIILPPFNEQRAVANILDTFDYKIELNRRMNETLEQMARALFKSWFVDFDPVRAKMDGRWQPGQSLPGLPAELYDLFPDRLVPSELGEIPYGWGVTTLGDISYKPQYGYTASAQLEPVGPKFLRITDINKLDWIEWQSVPFCVISDQDYNKYHLTKGEIVIARMADPGHGAMIEQDLEAVFASYLIRFRPKVLTYARFIQYWLRSDNYWSLVQSRSVGTTRVSLNAKVLSQFLMLRPSEEVVAHFAKYVDAIRDRIILNVVENEGLTELRDTLLPRLLSGEIRVE